ncbi:MAG: GNAT family N-acetyltransferase [Proteobacteria bacterium]|nr:GNAT family N-acetyltransferase [Pseudomonadota bacterium]
MSRYTTKALDASTWPDFARLVEANNGVWGGCWCMWYHGQEGTAEQTPAMKRQAKEQRVRAGQAHASLVYDGDDCVGWCQFGSPLELPRIHNSRTYLATRPELPDWRITCFFSGKGYRGKGVAFAALQGALAQIETLGGGRVEGYPEDTEGRKASPAFLFNGALTTFERLGFTRTRLIGKHKWVVNLSIPSATVGRQRRKSKD